MAYDITTEPLFISPELSAQYSIISVLINLCSALSVKHFAYHEHLLQVIVLHGIVYRRDEQS